MLDFTFSGYKKLISLMVDNGFEFLLYSGDFFDKFILLRHDIDFSLENALDLAKIEYMMGIKSTFFVQLGSPFYNLFNRRSKDIINQIIRMNHDIALHFDASNYVFDSYHSLIHSINYEISTLCNLTGQNISHYSFHSPSTNPLDFSELYSDKRYVHSIKFDSIKYISDSRMAFREDFMKYLEDDSFTCYQINLHPLYYKEHFDNIGNRLLDFLDDSKRRIRTLIELNIDGFNFNHDEE